MARQSTTHVCTECGAHAPRWSGKCAKCGQLNTLVLLAPSNTDAPLTGLRTTSDATVTRPARQITTIDSRAHDHEATGIPELDRVLGGGTVKGQVLLIAGAPGAGKSTLLLEMAAATARLGKTVLIVSGEESAEQIKLRATRINADDPNMYIADDNDLAVILAHINDINPDVLIIDSVQTIASPDVESRVGSISQVHEVAATLTRTAKARGMTTWIVSQVLKDTTQIAGPMQLQHIVDTVTTLAGDPNSALRMLRIEKNRFGATDEVACFIHEEDGLTAVTDPSGLFIGHRTEPVPGTCVTVTMEGRRALLAEVQALIASTNAPNPRRGVSGLDTPRAQMLLAVTERHGRIRLFDKDAYVATVAGMRITDPATDLALCLAVASAATEQPVPVNMCAIGEVALSGDIRPAPSMPIRLAEAARMGYTRALVPAGTKPLTGPLATNLTLITVDHLQHAFAALSAAQPGDLRVA